MTDHISAADFNAHYRINRNGRAAPKKREKKGRSLIRHTTAEYKGRKYQSRFERDCALVLDYLRMNGVIERWERQVKFTLPDTAITPTGRPKTYRVDFRVWLDDEHFLLFDPKSSWSRKVHGDDRIQWVEHYHGVKIHMPDTERELMDIIEIERKYMDDHNASNGILHAV